jgi:hypothetical protein
MGSTTANSERRNSTRKRPPSLIYVELSAANGGMMRDLSEEGFALRAMMPLRVGDEIFFSFLLDPITRVEGQGEVLWIEENGRVAGARFTEINSAARRQIRSWLNDELESQEAEKNAPPEADAQSFEMLREELRSAPPRPDPPKPKANKSKWPVARPENVPSEGPSFTSRGASEENPDNARAATPAGAGKRELARNPADSDSFPGFPDFSVTQDGAEIAFEPLSSPEPVRDTFPVEQPARRSEVTAIPKRPDVQAPKGPMLPDISEILMQPPRRQGGYASNPPMLEPLVPPYPRAGGKRGFSLSHALMIMVALALIVGGFVYRDMVGQGLVWLGQQIGGGSQGNEAPTPVQTPKEEAPAAETNPPSSNTPAAASSSAPASSGAAPESSQKETNAAETSPYSTKPQPALPSLEKKPQPPVTPLSGISSSQGSDTGQEAGSAEYNQAMQLLHDGLATDTSEAVRMLWISVEKGNPNAELTLAELYWRGQGVARNCDQTGILLGAAARKGNVVAQKRLKQFRQEGCE